MQRLLTLFGLLFCSLGFAGLPTANAQTTAGLVVSAPPLVNPGDVVDIQVTLTNPVATFRGPVFTFSFNPAHLETLTPDVLDVSYTGSIMGENGVTFFENLNTSDLVNGNVTFELTRLGDFLTNAEGLICTITLRARDNVPNGTLTNVLVTNASAFDENFFELDLTGSEDEIQIGAACNLSVDILPNGPTQFCDGGTVTLDAGDGFDSYEWSTGESSRTIDVTVGGVYAVTVTDGECQASDEITVSVFGLPAVDILFNGQPASQVISACIGTPVTLSIANEGGSIQWNTGSTSNSTTVTQSGLISVSFTDGNGCTGGDQVSVSFENNPDVVISYEGGVAPDVITTCEGDAVILTVNAEAGILWSNGSTDASTTVTQAGPVSVTVANGECSGADQVFVEFVPNPDPSISADGLLEFCLGGSVTLDAGEGFAAYAWSNGQTDRSITVTASGEYGVVVTTGDGCQGTDSRIVTVNNPPAVTADATNAPNATISGTLQGAGPFDVEIRQGEQIIASFTDLNAGAYEDEGYEAGDYTVRVTDANGCVTDVPLTIDELGSPGTICVTGPTTGEPFSEGQTFQVSVVVSDVAVPLRAITAFISYNTEYLDFVSGTAVTTFIPGAIGLPAQNNDAAGLVEVGIASQSGQSSAASGTIFRLTFRVAQSPTTDLGAAFLVSSNLSVTDRKSVV